ncbi:hypothetical protein [Serratia marcescens]|uniref:hypothetical protein n=1 Tax=Serratia marcescens TaxID=615 RepID=UPI001114E24F|nr:hypothetical protein [Serratia marcescens]
MRSFAARLPNLLLFLAFVDYPARSAAGLPVIWGSCLPMVQRLPCAVARRPANGYFPPCIPLPWPFTDSGPDLAAVA